eukprot:g3414.t1
MLASLSASCSRNYTQATRRAIFLGQGPVRWSWSAPQGFAKTKIVCTLGPASSEATVLRDMVTKGMDVCRLNFSHGKHADHVEVAKRIREVGRDTGLGISILCDIQGPKIRVGPMQQQIIAHVNDHVLVTDQEIEGGGEALATTAPDQPVARLQIRLPGLCDTLKSGDPVFIND